ncbi:amidohydrolase family protein [uncultured Sphaerochaeta sp.]|uniref:amidohydrolase family protein n=1 Tax=uncultured Sphaerochaeta sp. TaxID=886478 RepID=UPI0029CA69F3|nr:amidohydrolase family protein [uncultured Sphaerochaeta sp.]
MVGKKYGLWIIGFLLVFILLITSCLLGPRAVRLELPKPKEVNTTQAFVHATVIPMTEPDKIIENAVVIVEDKKIVYVGTDYKKIPASADRIDCTGKWIVPGLADAHVHLLFNALDPLLFLANGVTSIRNMASFTEAGRDDARFAFSDHLEFRDSVREKEVLSPWVYQASPIHEARTGKYFDKSLYLDTRSANEGLSAVRSANEKGFDYFKVYNKLPSSAFYSSVIEAKKLGMPVVGHVPHEVGIEEVIDGSLMHSIAHLTGYINPFGTFKIASERIDEIANRTADAGIWNVPTLEVWRNIVTPEHIDAIDADPWTRYISPSNRTFWSTSIESFSKLIQKQVEEYSILPSQHMEDFSLIVRALIKANAPIAAGTDSGTLNVVAGTSLHKELEGFVVLGMTPWEAIAASTVRASECFEKSEEFGTVQAGLRADLLVLDSNPLEDISNLRDINLVVVQGVPYRQSELVGMLDQMAEKNSH